MTRDELIETLASIEHERWADWQKYVHSRCEHWGPVGSDETTELVIPHELVEQWECQILTPYAHLSEAEKQADRDQVARYWPVLVQFVADWLADTLQWDEERAADTWREEMA